MPEIGSDAEIVDVLLKSLFIFNGFLSQNNVVQVSGRNTLENATKITSKTTFCDGNNVFLSSSTQNHAESSRNFIEN